MTDPGWRPKPGPIRSRVGIHVPRKGDLGLMSSGQQGLCRAGIAPAAVGPGGCVCPRRVSAALSPAAAAPLTAAVTWHSLAPSLYCRGASGSQGDRVKFADLWRGGVFVSQMELVCFHMEATLPVPGAAHLSLILPQTFAEWPTLDRCQGNRCHVSAPRSCQTRTQTIIFSF